MKIVQCVFLIFLVAFQIHQILKNQHAYKKTNKKSHKIMVYVFSIILVITLIAIVATYLDY